MWIPSYRQKWPSEYLTRKLHRYTAFKTRRRVIWSCSSSTFNTKWLMIDKYLKPVVLLKLCVTVDILANLCGCDGRVLLMICSQFFSNLTLILKYSNNCRKPGGNALGLCPNREMVSYEMRDLAEWCSKLELWAAPRDLFCKKRCSVCNTKTSIAGNWRKHHYFPNSIMWECSTPN